MGDERWNRVDRLLQSALDRPAAEREIFLERACGGDEQLERELRSRLAAHDRASGFLSAAATVTMARALLAAGDHEESAAVYKDLLALWNDADPEAPIVMQARSEHASLLA